MTGLVAAAVLAPAGAAVAAALLPGRPVRRIAWFAAMSVALVAAGGAFWHAYEGTPLQWRSFRAGLFPITLVASLHLGVLLAGARAARLGRRGERLALTGAGAATTAAAGCALGTSVAVVAAFVPLTTIAVAAATLSAGRDALAGRGLAGLAMSDVAAVAGLWSLSEATASTVLSPGQRGSGVGLALLLASAAVKAGAVPAFGASVLGADGAAGGLLSAAVRAQGIALALPVAMGAAPGGAAWIAAVACLLAVGTGVWTLGRGSPADAAGGVAPCVLGIAVALGGGVGGAAFAVLAVPLPLLWGAASMLLGPGVPEPAAGEEAPRPAEPVVAPDHGRWVVPATFAAGAVLASLLLVPVSATFPGGWLTLALAGVRAAAAPAWLIPVVAVALAVALAAAGGIRGLRTVAPTRLAIPGLAVGAASVYAGIASGPLAAGWLARAADQLGLPRVLPAAAPPMLPPFPLAEVALALAPGVLLVAALVWRAGGVRPVAPVAAPGPRGRARPGPLRRVAAVPAAALARVRSRGAAWAVALIAEGMAVLGIVRVVSAAAARGFL